MEIWRPAYVGMGSNLQGPHAQVIAARDALARIPLTRMLVSSPLYRSRPLGPIAQPDFVNAVAGLLTQLEPRPLLEQLQALEAALGRPPRHERWGPRIIDLDLLSYGRERCSEAGLTLPHPAIVERNFVLYPLADIAPDLDLPGLGRVADLKKRVSSDGLTLL